MKCTASDSKKRCSKCQKLIFKGEDFHFEEVGDMTQPLDFDTMPRVCKKCHAQSLPKPRKPRPIMPEDMFPSYKPEAMFD